MPSPLPQQSQPPPTTTTGATVIIRRSSRSFNSNSPSTSKSSTSSLFEKTISVPFAAFRKSLEATTTPTTESLSEEEETEINDIIKILFQKSFPDGLPADKATFTRQKRDYLETFNEFAATATTQAQLLKMVLVSHAQFVDEVETRKLGDIAEEIRKKAEEYKYFEIKGGQWIVYLIVGLLVILCKWFDDRCSSAYAKSKGMERHVLEKVTHFNNK